MRDVMYGIMAAAIKAIRIGFWVVITLGMILGILYGLEIEDKEIAFFVYLTCTCGFVAGVGFLINEFMSKEDRI